MSETRASLEIIAPSVEEAVARGLTDLGMAEEAVEVEVLDAGSKGLFGLGFRQARVRLTIKGRAAEMAAPVIEAAPPVVTPETAVAREPLAVAAVMVEPAEPAAHEADEALLETARAVVQDLLKAMKVRARVTVQTGHPEDPQDRTPVQVDIRGDDLSILIGPKAETLNALQYIAGLIISKEVGHSVPLVVDVEGFRARRSQQIRQIARRMAEQAVRTGKRQALEPMPASERRLVHIELRDHPEVSTESVGEEPRRKVTIIPK